MSFLLDESYVHLQDMKLEQNYVVLSYFCPGIELIVFRNKIYCPVNSRMSTRVDIRLFLGHTTNEKNVFNSNSRMSKKIKMGVKITGIVRIIVLR